MPAVLVTVPTVAQNMLRPLSTSSIVARHLLGFMVQGLRTIGSPTSIIHPLFLCQMPFLSQASQFILAWGQAANGLYTQWLGVCVLSRVLIITTTVDLYTGSMIL